MAGPSPRHTGEDWPTRAPAAVTVLESLDDVTCAICLEIYDKDDKPLQIPCSHVFCSSCLQRLSTIAEPSCPLCQERFRLNDAHLDANVSAKLKQCKAKCQGCQKLLRVYNMRKHMQVCKKSPEVAAFHPVAPTSQSYPPDMPNRATFKCPFCGMRNLDVAGLRTHCNERHVNSSARVVCPVCASMPWGNPSQTSGNFLEHLNLRHKFEYDTFVDYEQDDDAMLQMAMAASLAGD